MLGQQCGCDIDSIPREHARTTDKTPAFDRTDSIQLAPLREKRSIDSVRERRRPEHAALVLARDFERTRKLREISFARARTLVVAHTCDHTTALFHRVDCVCHQRTRFIALSR